MMKEETPRANRFHIGLFGRRNSGKSSLVNMLTGQQVAVVSDVPGTTTDVVLKNIELPGVGASVLVDTAGYTSPEKEYTYRCPRPSSGGSSPPSWRQYSHSRAGWLRSYA